MAAVLKRRIDPCDVASSWSRARKLRIENREDAIALKRPLAGRDGAVCSQITIFVNRSFWIARAEDAEQLGSSYEMSFSVHAIFLPAARFECGEIRESESNLPDGQITWSRTMPADIAGRRDLRLRPQDSAPIRPEQ
jgi:hypothetical protein